MESKTHDEAVHKMRELIQDVQVAMLTTVDGEGCLHSRPMATQKNGVRREALVLHRGRIRENGRDRARPPR